LGGGLEICGALLIRLPTMALVSHSLAIYIYIIWLIVIFLQYVVIIPDLFEGDSLDPRPSHLQSSLKEFQEAHSTERVDELVHIVAGDIRRVFGKDQRQVRLGAVGYGWGGKFRHEQ
jgi:hypothetical protein